MADLSYRVPYLTEGLIAYIGNKRRLLSFLGDAFLRCAAELPAGRPVRFLDPFAGSGSVSRLARLRGFAVETNDLEYYAALIGRCRIVCDPDALEEAFAPEGGSARAFAALDAFASGQDAASSAELLPPGGGRDAWREAFRGAEGAEPYIARHYAPERTETADWRRERLFYTAENGRYLDRAREAVELRYPRCPLDDGAGDYPELSAKAALTDALLYGAATHTNTSGVFKACHRGFGGHGADALGRILAPIRIAPPALVFGPPGRACRMDAAAFCASRTADIAYLDPPYNQHQYGSNYHLLTTVAKWDKPPVPEDHDERGYLANRSGIRPDWVETRSDYCSRPRARSAFESLLSSLDVRFVLLSYNDGGMLSQEELAELLSRHGTLRVETTPYTAYRGGKQSARRLERTREFLFVLDRGGVRGKGADLGAVVEQLARRDLLARAEALCGRRFHPDRCAALLRPRELSLTYDFRGLRGPLLSAERLSSLPMDELAATVGRLESAACSCHDEALGLVLDVLERLEGDDARASSLAEEAAYLLGKLAFRKYGTSFRRHRRRLRGVLNGDERRFGRAAEKLRRLEGVAEKRGLGDGASEGGAGS